MLRHSATVILATSVLYSGCSAGLIPGVQLQPTAISAGEAAPITFTRLLLRVPSGTEIGHHHDGLLKVQRFPYRWQSNLTVASDEFKVITSETLKSYGYDVKGGDNLLFGADESAKAEYQLGGTVTELGYNTFGSLAGNYSEARLVIEWQIYDALARRIVFADTTEGYGKLSGTSSPVVQDAFRSALMNLMAHQGFATQLRRRPSEMWAAKKSEMSRTRIAACRTKVRSLPTELPAAMPAVLVIRSGASTGSGVLVSNDGYALTAAHVVSGLKEVVVKLRNELELTAAVVAVDDAQDIALIRVPGQGHACLPMHQAGAPQIGTELYAIGAPAGEELAFSVTKGIVSGVRTWRNASYVQTDASLNPGNSGGPLLTAQGKVLGIVSWKVAAPGFEGLSFGVPHDAVTDRLAIDWTP